MIKNNTSIVGLLGVLFIGLKLAGYIRWPWVWVTAPLWAPPTIVALVLVIVLLCTFIFNSFKKMKGLIKK